MDINAGYLGVYFSSPERIEALKSAIKFIKEMPQVPARLLASVIGKIMTMFKTSHTSDDPYSSLYANL